MGKLFLKISIFFSCLLFSVLFLLFRFFLFFFFLYLLLFSFTLSFYSLFILVFSYVSFFYFFSSDKNDTQNESHMEKLTSKWIWYGVHNSHGNWFYYEMLFSSTRTTPYSFRYSIYFSVKTHACNIVPTEAYNMYLRADPTWLSAIEAYNTLSLSCYRNILRINLS
jgi:hypothetical protein